MPWADITESAFDVCSWGSKIPCRTPITPARHVSVHFPDCLHRPLVIQSAQFHIIVLHLITRLFKSLLLSLASVSKEISCPLSASMRQALLCGINEFGEPIGSQPRAFAICYPLCCLSGKQTVPLPIGQASEYSPLSLTSTPSLDHNRICTQLGDTLLRL